MPYSLYAQFKTNAYLLNFSVFLTASIFVAVALMLRTSRAAAQTNAPVKITGQIVNGTKGAKISSTANLPVTLYLALDAPTHTFSLTTQTDAGGQFNFSLQDTPAPTYYLVATNYSGVDYSSDVVPYDREQIKQPIDLIVYETTTDPSVVRVTQTHFVFDVRTRVFSVLQVIVVQNSGDRTFIGAPSAGTRRATLSLPILAGASAVQFDQRGADETTLRGDSALTYTLPILPGADQIVYHYSMPFTPPTYQFDLKMPVSTEKFRILLSDVGATITSAQLIPASPFQAQGGQKFLLSTAENLSAGTTIKATFANLPATVAEPARSTNLDPYAQMIAALVLTAAGVAAIALLVYPIARRRDVQISRRMDPAAGEVEPLLQTIANLDDDFAAGKISEAEHKEKRAAVKARLLAWIK